MQNVIAPRGHDGILSRIPSAANPHDRNLELLPPALVGGLAVPGSRLAEFLLDRQQVVVVACLHLTGVESNAKVTDAVPVAAAVTPAPAEGPVSAARRDQRLDHHASLDDLECERVGSASRGVGLMGSPLRLGLPRRAKDVQQARAFVAKGLADLCRHAEYRRVL